MWKYNKSAGLSAFESVVINWKKTNKKKKKSLRSKTHFLLKPLPHAREERKMMHSRRRHARACAQADRSINLCQCLFSPPSHSSRLFRSTPLAPFSHGWTVWQPRDKAKSRECASLHFSRSVVLSDRLETNEEMRVLLIVFSCVFVRWISNDAVTEGEITRCLKKKTFICISTKIWNSSCIKPFIPRIISNIHFEVGSETRTSTHSQ